MTGVRIAEGLLREALRVLGACGAGHRECVTYLTGPLAEPGLVDAVLHPRHDGSAGGYTVDPEWLNETWIEMARTAREIRLQIHTHPGAAYHSAIDDELPIAQTAGFLSLVIPRFAKGPFGLAGAFLAELDSTGRWVAVEPSERLVITS